MSVLANLRMKAMRLEEGEDWHAVASAWHDALAEMANLKDGMTEWMFNLTHAEISARAKAAEQRADEPTGVAQPLHKVEAQAEANEKSDEERVPSAVTHLDAGNTEGSSGAR